ncbi:transposase [Blautia wexlerae]|uniref:transposase n=1 Tax=Blautia wexlerae TaxID=418240 RepID=UPI001FAB7BAC|nr:transposase [Blautia wexlerae]
MLLSKRTSIKVSREYANLIGHMCYAASKLWNVCNYERQHYKETGMEQYPDWYYQKKAHKEDLWYKQLPSQTAQEVCKLLDKAWKSFYALKRSGGIETPRPPRFKQESIPITYMQMGIVHERDTDRVRYAASKLWNVCNYERQHYKETGMAQYPDWYYQKKAHKKDLWYKQLPSQTAQEVCRLLDKAWKSFYALKRSGGIEAPRPPRFKQESIPITYMQMGIVHERDTDRVRLSLPKALKKYMEETYQIHENFLYLENKIFRGMDQIKQLRIYPPEKGNCKIIVVYEVPDQEELPQNGHELSIDLGLHNLMTCYDSENGKTFILGRKYLELERYFHKEIARVQAQWYGQQSGKGVDLSAGEGKL